MHLKTTLRTLYNRLRSSASRTTPASQHPRTANSSLQCTKFIDDTPIYDSHRALHAGQRHSVVQPDKYLSRGLYQPGADGMYHVYRPPVLVVPAPAAPEEDTVEAMSAEHGDLIDVQEILPDPPAETAVVEWPITHFAMPRLDEQRERAIGSKSETSVGPFTGESHKNANLDKNNSLYSSTRRQEQRGWRYPQTDISSRPRKLRKRKKKKKKKRNAAMKFGDDTCSWNQNKRRGKISKREKLEYRIAASVDKIRRRRRSKEPSSCKKLRVKARKVKEGFNRIFGGLRGFNSVSEDTSAKPKRLEKRLPLKARDTAVWWTRESFDDVSISSGADTTLNSEEDLAWSRHCIMYGI